VMRWNLWLLCWVALLVVAARSSLFDDDEAMPSTSSFMEAAEKAYDTVAQTAQFKHTGGGCCRICPNTFYAVPRVVPRPKQAPPPSPREIREARFQSIFQGVIEPTVREIDDYALIATAEQVSASHHHVPHVPRWRGVEQYPPWPKHREVLSADPYLKKPVPYYTKLAAEPGIKCCNICPLPGSGQIAYPHMLTWGEDSRVDAPPPTPYKIPCCKLCSSGCFTNGKSRAPGREAKLPKRKDDSEEEQDNTNFSELLSAVISRNRAQLAVGDDNRTAEALVLQETVVPASMFSETLSKIERRRKLKNLHARGDWPKGLDPPGANEPIVPKEPGCAKMAGCCTVCYNHPMIYDHAPSGIW